MTDDDIEYYKDVGAIYGYPDCCTTYFVTRVMPRGKCPKRLPLEGTGYVACPECRKKPIKELIETINKNRTIGTPFPINPDDTREEALQQVIYCKLNSKLDFFEEFFQVWHA